MCKKIFLLAFLALNVAWNMPSFGASAPASKKFIVVIDPGHGGHDPGAIGSTTREKVINLSIALEVGRLIEKNCSDVKVIYTRKKDEFVPLDERANIANKNKADLFISIHTNSLPSGKIARGAETYTLGMAKAEANLEVAKKENNVILVEDNYREKYEGFNPSSSESYIMFEYMQDKYMEQSVEFARLIQNKFVSTANRADRGVHQAGFLVLRCTSMPSVLIELGYISTPDEEQYLTSDEGISNMSKSIYEAFLNYRHNNDGRIKTATISSNDDAIVGSVPTVTATASEPAVAPAAAPAAPAVVAAPVNPNAPGAPAPAAPAVVSQPHLLPSQLQHQHQLLLHLQLQSQPLQHLQNLLHQHLLSQQLLLQPQHQRRLPSQPLHLLPSQLHLLLRQLLLVLSLYSRFSLVL